MIGIRKECITEKDRKDMKEGKEGLTAEEVKIGKEVEMGLSYTEI